MVTMVSGTIDLRQLGRQSHLLKRKPMSVGGDQIYQISALYIVQAECSFVLTETTPLRIEGI